MELLTIFLITTYTVQEDVPPQLFNLENGMKAFIQKGKHAFFLSNMQNLTIGEYENFTFSSENILVGCGYGTMYFFFLMGYNFYIAFCLTAVVTLWLATNDFCEKSLRSLDVHLGLSDVHYNENSRKQKDRSTIVVVKKNADDTHENDNAMFAGLLENYTKLKKLASSINESLGEVFLMCPFFICFYYATELTIIFTPDRKLNKISIYWFLIKEAALMILAADICRKVSMLIRSYNLFLVSSTSC